MLLLLLYLYVHPVGCVTGINHADRPLFGVEQTGEARNIDHLTSAARTQDRYKITLK